MPVGTYGAVKAMSPAELDEIGAQIILGNTSTCGCGRALTSSRRTAACTASAGWQRPILTDSGGFQVFSLGALRKVREEGVTFRSHLDGSSHFFSPESAMEAEIGLGADIIMAFDECTEFPAERERARASMEMTLRWAERSSTSFADQRYPGEQQQDSEQDEEARCQHRGDDQQQIERGHCGPNLNEALKQEIGPAAEIALHGTRRHSNDRTK